MTPRTRSNCSRALTASLKPELESADDGEERNHPRRCDGAGGLSNDPQAETHRDGGGEEAAAGGEEPAGGGAEAGGGGAEAGGADDLLVATPSKRDDEIETDAYGKVKRTKTAKSKGWYTPVDYDKRTSGARKQNMRSKYSGEFGRSARTRVPGMKDLRTLSAGIIQEQDTNYREEELLFEATSEIKDLISQMEKRDET